MLFVFYLPHIATTKEEGEALAGERMSFLQSSLSGHCQFRSPGPHQTNYYFNFFGGGTRDLKLAWPQGGTLFDNGTPGEGRGGG